MVDRGQKYKDFPKVHKTWLYSPGENASKWDMCLSQNIMCIGWDEMGNLLDYSSKEDMTIKLQEIYEKTEASFKNDSLALWEFTHEMQIGDIVIVKKGQNQMIGRGIVESDYVYDETLPDFRHVRKMQWTNIGEWKSASKNVQKTLTDISKYPDYVKKLEKLFEEKSQKYYWWLVANPKIWSLSKTPVGEVQSYTLYNDNGNQRRIFQNFIDAKEGDIVIGYEATPVKQIVAIAEVAKAADDKQIYFKKTEALLNPIDFSAIKNIPELNGMEFFKNMNGSFFKLSENEYNILLDLIRDENPKTTDKLNLKYSEGEFLDEVFMDSAEYTRLKSLLLGKKNIILQGAPGVGKTYSAKRLAYSIIGEKNESRIEFIHKKHHPDLKAKATQIDWSINRKESTNNILPIMQTDIMLTLKERTLIIDTKYYSKSMQYQFGKKSIHSNNLYQIYSYVMNHDVDHTGKVDGMLLYAKTEEDITPDGQTKFNDGNVIYYRSLDLNQDFKNIKKQLDGFV